MRDGRVIIIGAGIGGLAAAARLAHASVPVTVLEQHAQPGGKMRTVPSDSGPVDAGPTVLTMRPVFEDLFESLGETLSDHLSLQPLDILARHYWADGTTLDLHADPAKSIAAVAATFGSKTAKAFTAFSARAKRLFSTFDAPMMQHASPSQLGLAQTVMRQPQLIADMAPHRTLHTALRRQLREPKLVQLFGRYATYVGGSPFQSPALLSLIWQAEAAGVWSVEGGMHQLAQTLEHLAKARGAVFHYNTPVARIVKQGGRVSQVVTDRDTFQADQVLFNGDPRALSTGLLGPAAEAAVSEKAVTPRSLSPEDATLYVCAQDAAGGVAGPQKQRFEIIRNAPPALQQTQEDTDRCLTLIQDRFATFGLNFTPAPGRSALTAPMDFDRMFPASQGSLYGRSPHGLTAALQRPTATTPIKGLYLCGGGTHPGAGVPMATLSGKHAAAAILKDRGRAALTTTPDTLKVGPSSMHWDGDKLIITIDEISSPPLISRVRGTITVRPKAITSVELARELWHPCTRDRLYLLDVGPLPNQGRRNLHL